MTELTAAYERFISSANLLTQPVTTTYDHNPPFLSLKPSHPTLTTHTLNTRSQPTLLTSGARANRFRVSIRCSDGGYDRTALSTTKAEGDGGRHERCGGRNKRTGGGNKRTGGGNK